MTPCRQSSREPGDPSRCPGRRNTNDGSEFGRLAYEIAERDPAVRFQGSANARQVSYRAAGRALDGVVWVGQRRPLRDELHQASCDATTAAVQDTDDDFLANVAALGRADGPIEQPGFEGNGRLGHVDTPHRAGVGNTQ